MKQFCSKTYSVEVELDKTITETKKGEGDKQKMGPRKKRREVE